MSVYKVSYVVTGSDHPGAIVNREIAPTIGERIRLGENEFEVVEVLDLMPPRGDFHYLHATVQLIQIEKEKVKRCWRNIRQHLFKSCLSPNLGLNQPI